MLANYGRAVSLVYNLRIRRAFNLSAALGSDEKKSLFVVTALPIVYKRTRTITDPTLDTSILDNSTYEKRCVTGSLFNMRYVSPHSWWLEMTTAVAKERACSRGALEFNACRKGFDDIVFTGGSVMHLSKNAQCVIYALAGFPTRRCVTPLEAHDTFLGTRFFSVGAGLEFSYSFFSTLAQSCFVVVQTRIIHFFKRRWDPILPANAFIKPGDVVDVLLTLNYRKRKNIFEVGYNPTWFLHQAVLLPTGPVLGKEHQRQGVYASFNRVFIKFPLIRRPVILGTGINNTWSRRFNTHINSYWVNISVIF